MHSRPSTICLQACQALETITEKANIDPSKPVPHTKETVLKVIAHNSSEAALSYHQDLIIYQIDVSRSHIDTSLAGPILAISYLILFSSTRLEDFCCGLKISPLGSPSNLSGQDEQLADNVKVQLIISQRKEIVVEIINPLQFRNRTRPHAGVQIWVHHHKNLRSRYTALTFKPKMELTEIYLDICDLSSPWNSRNSEDPVQSSVRPLLRTLQKTSEKIQIGSSVQAY
ncbi:hypothetical protein ACTXT7_014554 [Hymenolepis weldensis]